MQPGGGSAASSSGSLPAAQPEGGAASASRHACPDLDVDGGRRETTAQDSTAALAESLAEKRKRCKNTMHVALTLMSDPDVLWKVRLILLTCAPITLMHNQYCEELKSPQGVLGCYVRWAGWQWLPVLHAVCSILADTMKLGRIGFTVSFSYSGFGKGAQFKAKAAHEDACASDLSGLVFQLVRNRASSMMFHSGSYPGMLASLLDENPATIKEAFATLKLHSLAFSEAKSKRSPSIVRMAERSVMNFPIMLVICHLAKASDWRMSPELRAFLLDIFQGYGHSIVVEKAFHFARDDETRSQASKVMSTLRKWSSPVRHEVLKQFEREELEPTTTLPVPEHIPQALFKAVHVVGPSVSCLVLVCMLLAMIESSACTFCLHSCMHTFYGQHPMCVHCACLSSRMQ